MGVGTGAQPGGEELQRAEDLLLYLGLLGLLSLQSALLLHQHPHGQPQAPDLGPQGLHLIAKALPEGLQGSQLIVWRWLPPLGLVGWVLDADAGVGSASGSLGCWARWQWSRGAGESHAHAGRWDTHPWLEASPGQAGIWTPLHSPPL